MTKINGFRKGKQMAFVLLLVSLHAYAIDEKPTWVASPSAVYKQNGSYPSSVVVRLFWNGCQYDSAGQIKPGQLTGSFSITITGTATKAGSPSVGDCSLTATLDLSGAQPGLQELTVQKDGKDAGFASLAFMDVAPRPTPDQPEVDVLWDVLTDHLCSDNFGNHLKGDLYCVDVKIGNNSGYTLQLAGLGFMRKSLSCKLPNGTTARCTPESDDIATPNVGYQTVRASAQNSSLITGRNIFVNGMQAIGLLMASFTPYFENSFNKSRWSTGAAIVGTAIPQATNLVSPDLTVRELNNLDDQAFREGKTIPNNTQERLLVFLQKKSVAEAISDTVGQIEAASTETCTNPMRIGYSKIPGGNNQCHPAWQDGFKNCLKKLDCNPMVVKLALGRLVIIGDKIQYIQRIVVDSTVSSQETPTPMTVRVADLVSGSGTNTLTGTGLQDVTKISLSCQDTNDPSKQIKSDITSGITKTSDKLTFQLSGVQLPNTLCDVTVTGKDNRTDTLKGVTPKAP